MALQTWICSLCNKTRSAPCGAVCLDNDKIDRPLLRSWKKNAEPPAPDPGLDDLHHALYGTTEPADHDDYEYDEETVPL